ncbi:hypothetical protein [Desertivirga xinjiangensis]|uniref:hypothetical protein n=1 Tax=Desertivirga xinjiangensis TaxID=539206 RepID=UPI00210AB7E9|nr:hypothetical protein [Pedobacter xinjiangensis]
MSETLTITGEDESVLWKKVTEHYSTVSNPREYHIALDQQGRRILLDIIEEPEGTIFSAYLYGRSDFRFAIYPQGFIDEIGKFFGMEDVVLGFKDFDDKYVVKTNQEGLTESLFADANIRKVFESIPGLSMGIVHYTLDDSDGKVPFLELKVDGCITEPILLRKIYNAFCSVLLLIEQ